MQKERSKTRWKAHNIANKNMNNNEGKIPMKKSFEKICDLFHEIEETINCNSKKIKLRQLYKYLLDEINTIKDEIEKILSDNNPNDNYPNLKDVSKDNKKSLNNMKRFEGDTKQLFHNKGINLEIIKTKSEKIREIIEQYRLKFEDNEKDIFKRNKYLEKIANLSVQADNFSYKLIGKLLKEFNNNNNKFKSIIFERAKEELSIWVNQFLNIDSHKKNKFFDENCSNEFKSSALNKDIKNDILLLHFNNLFSDLCELFVYAIIYSEKNIELKYIKKGEIYQPDEMIDITELNGNRYVNFTVLPGLSVNKKSFKFAKALVFCETDSKFKSQFNIYIPRPNNLILNETIKTEELKKKIKINFEPIKQNDICNFHIQTQPDIPEIDNPLFLFRYLNSNNKWVYFLQVTKQKIIPIKANNIPKNSLVSIDVQLNGEIICNQYYSSTNAILNS